MHAVNVMIVDDDDITLTLLEHIVDELVTGEILVFSSSIKANAFLLSEDAQRIGLVICDWQMPSVSGIKILETLRTKSKNCPFLMITANPTKDLVISAKRLGVTDFIAKPFSSDDLTQKLSVLLEKISPT
ncbi:response regulator [Paraglaciecola polaris]|uniref:Chemotaxis protein CheY n=1 Tax=Paraglaciecola polaris LMG 21857 TaxID=1129793 RepID=K7AJ40_9ALTE|nr:response regulator [Paraglaciecola polaris]GAC35245.1 chemotaxis protein CheY [Paraglaciecola polaris LMG 21857]|tara:strand:- start:5262 stop:5651 length:390 start_codon:yes stop_codon:yes gene_type:complete